MNTQLKSAPKVFAQFDKATAAKFITPLSDVIKIVDNSAIIRFQNITNAAGETYPAINIKAIDSGKKTYAIIEGKKDGLPTLTISEDCTAPIYDLGQLVGVLKSYADGFTFDLDVANKALITSSSDVVNGHTINYLLSDETTINKPPEKLGIDKLSFFTFNWDSVQYSEFLRAANVLNVENLTIEGKSGEDKVILAITNKGSRSSSSKITVKTDAILTADVNITIIKADFLKTVQSSISAYKISVSNKIVIFTGESDYHTVKYHISPVATTTK
jgi:hypothetical protein